MQLSYKDTETEKLSKKKLLEYVMGVKPETQIGKVRVDGLFPASQFHFTVSESFIDEPLHQETKYLMPEYLVITDLKNQLIEALKISGCGLVDIRFVGRTRIIITTTCAAKDREKWAETFAKVINEVLDQKKDEEHE